VETVNASTFKATCLALLKKVKRTGQPILVTLRGEPIAQVVPPLPADTAGKWLGSARGSGKILGDIVSPVEMPWEVLERQR
jgi:prevent-host-death family protein